MGRTQVIPRRRKQGAVPLSHAQQRLWFLNQYEPASPFYNLSFAFRILGRLNVDALRHAIHRVVSRHESLRTIFDCRDGVPVQSISPEARFAFSVLDLSDGPEADKESRRLTTVEAMKRFDLALGPLLRILLLRMGPESHILILTMHHIVTDGWSMGVFFRELEHFYGHSDADLAGLPVQYADFAVWEREWLGTEEFENELAYWTHQLGPRIAPLELPSDKKRPSEPSFRGAMETVAIPAVIVDSVRKLSAQAGTTAFTTMLAAFNILLYRYTRQEDMFVGSPVANRDREELESLIGFFVNTVVLRTKMEGNPTFAELLNRTREAVYGAYEHQHLPFDRLVEALRPGRDPGRSPLFQAMFALTPGFALRLPGVTVENLPTECVSSQFDLTLSVSDSALGMNLELVYDTDLFEARTIRGMASHYVTLLDGAVQCPDTPIDTLPVLGDAEYRKIVLDWNNTRCDFPHERPIDRIFKDQAIRTPEAIAVISGADSMTYSELDRRSGDLARKLQEMGIVPGEMVAVCVERAPALLIALLGVLKAGGAYVPLDPEYPQPRLAVMLEDSTARILVTTTRSCPRFPLRASILKLDTVASTPEPDAGAIPEATADNLAYVMYTSGSTGRPKGVAITHRAIARLVINAGYVRFQPGDTVAQVSNSSFDACTFEIWGALLNGARLVVIGQEELLSPARFATALARQRVDVLFLTAALFHEVAAQMPTAFRTVRDLLVGGEPPDPRWAAEVLRHGPPKRLLNAYGPTETTTFAATHEVKELPREATSIPIGRPIGNTDLYILGPSLQPVPPGVIGELCIGGPGLAQGYWRQPDLTELKFRKNPFRAGLTERIFLTGDLARFRPDGTIECLGRMDEQVKIRGYRVEPAEIRIALELHPGIRQAFVVAHECASGDRRLIAYVVTATESPSTGELFAWLRGRLPEYMVPSAFISVDRIPLGANGKVDKSALPAPAPGFMETGRGYLAPRDELERSVARIWEQTLGMSPIGVRDSFFELGGHSLMAVRLLSRIEREFGIRPPLASLFQAPTIEGLATILRQPRPQEGSRIVPIQARGQHSPFFCCHAGIGNLAAHLGSDQPCYALEPHGYDGRRAPANVEQMATNYIQELRSLRFDPPYYLGGCSFGGLVAFEMAQQLCLQGEEVALLALIDPTVPPNPLDPEARLPNKLRRHAARLTRLNLRGQWTYLHRRLTWRLGRRLQMLLCQAWITSGRRVPPKLRGFYFYEVALRAAEIYPPKPYSGRAILFGTEENDVSRWVGLVRGGCETHTLPGRHSDIFEEPVVQIVAEKLKPLLAGKKSASGVRASLT
jgi:amino acid adenylation domain-containing protein